MYIDDKLNFTLRIKFYFIFHLCIKQLKNPEKSYTRGERKVRVTSFVKSEFIIFDLSSGCLSAQRDKDGAKIQEKFESTGSHNRN